MQMRMTSEMALSALSWRKRDRKVTGEGRNPSVSYQNSTPSYSDTRASHHCSVLGIGVAAVKSIGVLMASLGKGLLLIGR